MTSNIEMPLAGGILRIFARWCGGEVKKIHSCFADTPIPQVVDGCLQMPPGSSARQSFLAAASEYLTNSQTMMGCSAAPEEAQSYQSFCIGLASALYGNERPESPKPISIGNRPTSFLILRDGVCPVLGLPFCEIEVQNKKIPGDYVCSQDCLTISNEIHDPVVEAVLVVSYFLNRKDPRLVSILVKDANFRNYLKLFLNDVYGNVSSTLFLFLLCAINGLDVENYGADVWQSVAQTNVKTAQQSPNFWLLGMLEKMLEPTRGVRTQIRQQWAPVVDSLYSEIDKERRKKGLTGAPLEFMLRIHAKGAPQDCTTSIVQSMLEDSRSW